MKYLLGIDLGTSATKTVLFDDKCQVKASSVQSYPLYQPQNGWAEQDPQDWHNAVLKTIKDVLQKSGVNGQDIKGIGLSGQMHGLVMLDKENQVIRPSIIWCDQRTVNECQEITDKVGAERLIEITSNPALTGFTASKILWVRNHEPQNYAKCRHILLPKDYIRFCMSGEYATEVSDASGMQLLDIKNRCWSDEVLEKLNIDKELLGKVYESPDVTGYISSEFAEKSGLSELSVIVGGAGDNAAAAIGTGVVKDGKAFTTIGTSGVVFAHTSQPQIDQNGRVHSFCCAVPGCWHVMGVTQAAGLSLKWFRDNLAGDYKDRAVVEHAEVYDLINAAVDKVPCGSNRLIYLPYLMGERTPHLNPDCRGVFFGLSAMHTKEDLFRAVMEGVSYSLKDCNDILRDLGITVHEMMACGGGSKSPVWRQMIADMYGCEVKVPVSEDGAVLGAAILAGVGAGVFKDIESACEHFVCTKDYCQPIAQNYAYYEKGHKLYQKLYTNLKECYSELTKL